MSLAVKSWFKVLQVTLGIVLLSSRAAAHGEDKPGPRGGHIRMPSAFHTELVPSPDGAFFDVYLVDIKYENPVIDGSTLKAQFKIGNGARELVCKPRQDFFRCEAPSEGLTAGVIILEAQRQGMKGGPALYELPLKDFAKH